MASPIDVPIVVIGGGGCGLMMSSMLSNLGVEHILFEKHPSTSFLPKAHYLNQRSMETFHHWGLRERILPVACPPEHMSVIQFKTSLGGNDVYDRRLLGSVPLSGLDPDTEDYTIYKYRCPLS
jgi:2,4-dichlorophenol 6-monooxygenase